MHDRTSPWPTLLVLALALAGDQWQCMNCGTWFSSPTGSQTCPNCS
ncbi:hypothetical protein G6W47_28880 [Streptomyces sp. CAI-21]|uniref:Uncharacterized protein n=1 Tax=Streptomyces fungicidicus TaxID=68203 RepID=A0ACC7Y997_9ACTN|nr:hypothetical protein [Streptomyces fungicidicus]NUV78221.1 hypothetical protein [Streptomyces fungicidicus]NUW10900.1 hypothetical protein [Streptomyces sp. CAI-21]